MTQPNTLVTVELTQVEAALVAQYLRAAQGPIGHTLRLTVIAKTIETEWEKAVEKDRVIIEAQVTERERLAKLADEAKELGDSAGYNHANYVYAYGGELADEAGIIVPDHYRPVATHFTAAFLEGQERYESEWEQDCED